MLVGSLYTCSRAEKYKVAWPGYTPEEKQNRCCQRLPYRYLFGCGLHSVSMFFGFPIDEIDDIPQQFEGGPSTLYTVMSMFSSA
jgi:hypothetical protein